MIPELRQHFNHAFTEEKYRALVSGLERAGRAPIGFRIAESPIFVPEPLLARLAAEGAAMAHALLADPAYRATARQMIPAGYAVARETPHPHFLTADFALVRDPAGEFADGAGPLAPRLVEIQAFPSVYGFQSTLCAHYRRVFGLPDALGCYLGSLDEASYWDLLRRTVVGRHDPAQVALTEIDPGQQKTLPDFHLTAERLGIAVVDIARLEPRGNVLHYRDSAGCLVPIRRIYNRAIADELIAKQIRLPFDLTHAWDVEWAGHPNWYFLISKFSVPHLVRAGFTAVPPAVFLSEFLEGDGRDRLAAAGVPLPAASAASAVYSELLLKPLFGFAGKGIQFEPTHEDLAAIPAARRGEFLLQQRMRFEPTIDTPHGLTQAEFRILYLWPDGGVLTPVLTLIRLGRGKMMGVDHNRDQQWVGASAAFFPR